jgi:hypothetical protein
LSESALTNFKAISFLNAHRESLLVILRENQQYLTLKGIEECKLIISILAMVVHKVPSEELVCLRRTFVNERY